MGVNIRTLVVGPVQTNCYLMTNEENHETICFDPGANANKIIEVIEREGLTLVGIMLTHGHFDHISGVNELRQHFQVKVYANEKEKELLASPNLNLSSTMMRSPITIEADELLTDGQTLNMAGFTVQAIGTPGHTIGGMCYYFPKEQLVFTGDTLFCGSMGRTDFPTGDMETLISSIKEKLLVLPEQTIVLPGHDRDTTIGLEKEEF